MAGPITFGRFTLDARECRLTLDGKLVALSPRPFDLLALLVERAGTLVTRDELLRAVWQGASVEPASLKAAVWTLRRAMGDGLGQLIETVPGRGYRFTGAVAQASDAEPVLPGPVRIIRAVVADDHAIVRVGVRTVLEKLPGIQTVGEAANLDLCFEILQQQRPDLLVLDLMFGDEPSLGRINEWRRAVPELRVIVLSQHDEDQYARRAIEAGAHAYVMKSELRELTAAVHTVLTDDYWISAKLGPTVLADFHPPR